jgi:hypothetical protein
MKANYTAGSALLMFLANASICFGQPIITNQPAPQATAPGKNVTFQVGARSIDPLTYQWQRNLGAGFSNLTDGSHATLVVTNVQPWDASDYRVIVANTAGARTSSVARLYVMRQGVVTTNVVLDNFDDNKLTGWTVDGHKGQGKLIETNQQFTVHGYWPGVPTVDLGDTAAVSHLGRSWSVTNGQTVELRVDLVGMDEHATAAGMDLWSGGSNGGYALFKGHDFIHLCKPSLSVVGIHGQFFHERVLIKNTNVVLALSITRVNPNVILTARVLDKDNNDAVLYERSVVDTPSIDRTLTQAEMEAASGMHMDAGTDVGPPITSGSEVFLSVFQYTDGTKPATEAIFDNLERWTSIFPIWRPEFSLQLLSTSSPNLNLKLSADVNSTWMIERALDPAGPWSDLTGSLLIGTNGNGQFQATNSLSPGGGFYRARLER